MKSLILSLAAASALAVTALPAAAQPWGDRYDDPRYDSPRYDDQRYGDQRYGDQRYDDRWYGGRRYDVINQLQMRVDRSFRNSRITRQEYYSLRNQVADLQRLEYRYMSDRRLTQWERNDLRRRANVIENRLRRERQDRDWGFYR